MPPGGLALRQAVDDAPEQDRLGEGRDRQRDVGERQDGADPQVGAELAEHAGVEAEKAIEACSAVKLADNGCGKPRPQAGATLAVTRKFNGGGPVAFTGTAFARPAGRHA